MAATSLAMEASAAETTGGTGGRAVSEVLGVGGKEDGDDRTLR